MYAVNRQYHYRFAVSAVWPSKPLTEPFLNFYVILNILHCTICSVNKRVLILILMIVELIRHIM